MNGAVVLPTRFADVESRLGPPPLTAPPAFGDRTFYPAAVIQQVVSTTLRNQCVMIEPWKVKVSSGGSQVDAIISEEQWRSLGELERLQLSAAITRTLRRRRSGLAPAIPQLSPEAAAQQRASVGIDVETVANAVAADTGIVWTKPDSSSCFPRAACMWRPPGTATVNAIEFYSNGDVIHPNLAGASSLEPDGTVRPAPAGRR